MENVDIKTHTDRSNHSGPKGMLERQVKKRNVWDWKDLGEQGTFMLIEKDQLALDLRYQREAVSAEKVKKIASQFNWVAFGALCVNMRKDGFFIIDGGNRWRATELRDDVNKLPCIVFDLKTPEEEAMAFLSLNTLTNAVKPYEKYVARLFFKDPIAVLVEEELVYNDYKAVKYHPSTYETTAIGTLLDAAAKDPVAFRKSLSLTADIAGGAPIMASVFRGVFYLISRGQVDIMKKKNRDKLVNLGIEVIAQLINREKHLVAGGTRIEAAIILKVVNKNRRTNKLKMPSM